MKTVRVKDMDFTSTSIKQAFFPDGFPEDAVWTATVPDDYPGDSVVVLGSRQGWEVFDKWGGTETSGKVLLDGEVQ